MTASPPAKLPPGPSSSFLFGSLRDFRANPLRLLWRLWRDYGDVCRVRVATTEFYLINHPELIAHVLVDKDKRSGPRVYIGHPFSLMEMQMIVLTILQKFRNDVMPSPPIVPKPTFTLRPMYGVPVRAMSRSAIS